MEISISLGKNMKISDKAMSDFVDNVKKGECFGTIDHPETSLLLSDIMYKIDDIKEVETCGLVGNATPVDNFNGGVFLNMMKKYPNNFVFSPVGYCHNEINKETGEEETIIDHITSINATPKEVVDTNSLLFKLYDLHEKLAGVSSTKSKLDILLRFKESSAYITKAAYYNKIFNYIYDGDITFGTTSVKVDEFSKDTMGLVYSDFMMLLDDLSERKLTGDSALATTQKFVGMLYECYGKDTALMFKMILDKDFKCGVNVKTMGKVFPIKLPFSEYVALANKYFDREDKVDFKKERWLCSRKLDGNRLLLIKNRYGVRCISRQGKEIKTLGVLQDMITRAEGEFVLDGEVCIVDENGNENFQEIMKVITKKNYTIEHPVMKVFDILTEDEFFGRVQSKGFFDRYGDLCEFFRHNNDEIGGYFNLVEQIEIKSKEQLMELFAESRKKGWEGLMLRKDVPYECGRTNNLLKVKGFFDDEYKVMGYEMGNMRFVEEGRQVEKEVLAAIIINHKGFEVKVGSGFSKEEREYLHNHPEEIVGSIVKVQYFEETKNMQGGISLRFPTVVYFYGKDGRFD